LIKKERKEQPLPDSCLQTAGERRESRESGIDRSFQPALWLLSAIGKWGWGEAR